jgi:hypothetical protein
MLSSERWSFLPPITPSIVAAGRLPGSWTRPSSGTWLPIMSFDLHQ